MYRTNTELKQALLQAYLDALDGKFPEYPSAEVDAMLREEFHSVYHPVPEVGPVERRALLAQALAEHRAAKQTPNAA